MEETGGGGDAFDMSNLVDHKQVCARVSHVCLHVQGEGGKCQ